MCDGRFIKIEGDSSYVKIESARLIALCDVALTRITIQRRKRLEEKNEIEVKAINTAIKKWSWFINNLYIGSKTPVQFVQKYTDIDTGDEFEHRINMARLEDHELALIKLKSQAKLAFDGFVSISTKHSNLLRRYTLNS